MVAAAQLEPIGSFAFDFPAHVFRKANAATGADELRIGGLATTLRKDRADETVLQEGLNWSLVKEGEGHFIDEHNPSAGAVVGVVDPKPLAFYKRGQKLPDGETAPNPGWWVEGPLFDDNPDSLKIYNAAKSLQKIGRSLGFSVDGRVNARRDGKKTIVQADVYDIAITRHPMNPDARLRVLAKALEAARAGVGFDVLAKALSATTAGDSGSIPIGPISESDGGGRVLSREDFGFRTKAKKKKKPSYKGVLAKALIERHPEVSAEQIGRLLDLGERLDELMERRRHG